MAKRACILFFGDVEGTGYRFFIQQKAIELGLKGYCQKTNVGTVEVEIEGKSNAVDEFILFVQKGVSVQSDSNAFNVEIFDTLKGYTTMQSELL